MGIRGCADIHKPQTKRETSQNRNRRRDGFTIGNNPVPSEAMQPAAKSRVVRAPGSRSTKSRNIQCVNLR
jgi:hypothetical protein